MGLTLKNNYQLQKDLSLDWKYGPWDTIEDVLDEIPLLWRVRGLTVNIAGVEFWWRDVLTDEGLVEKGTGGGAAGFYAAATTYKKIQLVVDRGLPGDPVADATTFSAPALVGKEVLIFRGNLPLWEGVADTFPDEMYFTKDPLNGEIVFSHPLESGEKIIIAYVATVLRATGLAAGTSTSTWSQKVYGEGVAEGTSTSAGTIGEAGGGGED